MPVNGKTRKDAWAIVTEFTDSENLRRHMVAVEAAMRGYARQFGEDEETWGLVGLLHDFDYEKFQGPNGHPFVGVQILDKRGWPRDVRRAILSHADYTGVPRETRMEKALYAVDEMSGFLVACAMVRPSRSLTDLNVASVKKKMKDKSFCAAIEREELKHGATDLGIALDKHIENVIGFLAPIEKELGLGAAAAAPRADAAKTKSAKPAPKTAAKTKAPAKAAAKTAKKKATGKKGR
jgi:putative nucleotidyltransferase with HDIG domain